MNMVNILVLICHIRILEVFLNLILLFFTMFDLFKFVIILFDLALVLLDKVSIFTLAFFLFHDYKKPYPVLSIYSIKRSAHIANVLLHLLDVIIKDTLFL
jgi:hypothetical protein